MGWSSSRMSWRELEGRLSDRPFDPAPDRTPLPVGRSGSVEPSPGAVPGGGVPYAELHCHSHFSFLDGASSPDELVAEAVRLGLTALALTDHDGFYGVVRFAEAAREHGLPTVFGSELSLDASTPRSAVPDPSATHLLVLADDPAGYALLGTAISESQLAGTKGHPRLSLDRLTDLAGADPHWTVLTGCRKGAVPAALQSDGPAAARRVLDDLVERFGRHRVVVEIWDHGYPLDAERNDALARLSVDAGLDLVATNNVHYHRPARRRLATAMAAVRARRSMEELDGWLPPTGSAHLRSGVEQARRFARWPSAVASAADLGARCAFDLRLVAPGLPPYPCPDGLDEMSLLRRLAADGATDRYGERTSERVAGAWAQIDRELDVIAGLGFPGYFLVVWDIVEFCRREGILCQGRGSAANSAVCYALGITNADAVGLGLLFERFLSPERDGPPDIDLDIESGRREEVIQYVYGRYGRRHTAQVANVITYRARSAVRDAARALGYAPGLQDAFAKGLERRLSPAASTNGGGEAPAGIPADVAILAEELCDAPRHLGIHSGGMVICDRPMAEVCPVEWGRMANRSVLQWDKEDCAAVGLVKFDLLGLGMLSALHHTLDLVAAHEGSRVDLSRLEQDDAVYDMICAADTIGVFQIESRAQMATLPRLRPRCFHDLVVEIALIRPGPIQGGSVHPYIRRRNGQEEVTYLHPSCEDALAGTLGIPLFQEQLMRLSMDVAGFTAGEADRLRQAMGSKRSHARMEALHQRFLDGAGERGVPSDVAGQVWQKLAAFADYGFPESHAVSFAHLVYASSWLKFHHPAAFCAGLLNAQPMGFYSPHTLVQDARRHGVEVRTPDLNRSGADATLEQRSTGPGIPGASGGGPAIRMGIGLVRGIGGDLAAAIAAGRPYTSIEDLQRRVDPGRPVMEALATAGAFAGFDVDRREALWAAGALAATGPDRLPGVVTGIQAPPLPPMDVREVARADLWATGVSPEGHPTRFIRHRLAAEGVTTAVDLRSVRDGARVRVAGVVTHRQRPHTAGGVTFLNLEDETGLVNVVVSKGCWVRYRDVAVAASALLVRGRVEVCEGVVNVVAEHLAPLGVRPPARSRDFR